MVRASPHQGARTMAEAREAFIGIDAAKLRNAVAIADAGRDGEVRFLGEVDASPEGMRRLAARLAAKYDRLSFCYEAGPTGYGLHRLLTGLGHHCTVVAPSLIPRKPGDRVKTNRRDALTLARLLRAGELTAVWIPDPTREAMRDLVRARAAAVDGDFRRFATPRQLMAWLGLVPSERSSGSKVERGGITKAGNGRARRVLVEGAWSYRFPARVTGPIQARLEGVPDAVRALAWKAQLRLCARYRRLVAAGKNVSLVTTAIAREMAAFAWAIACQAQPKEAGA